MKEPRLIAFCLTALGLAASGSLHAQTAPGVLDDLGQQTLLTNQAPTFRDATDNTPYELGLRFVPSRDGVITAIRYWKPLGEKGVVPADPAQTYTHTGRIWTEAPTVNNVLGTAFFRNESPEGWQVAALDSPLRVQAGKTYVVTVNLQTNYVATNDVFTQPLANGSLSALADGNNGVYGPIGFRPASSYRSTNYFRDVVFVPTDSVVAINAGGGRGVLAREFVDGYISAPPNEGVTSTLLGIDRSGVAQPAPEAVYQTARFGTPSIDYPTGGLRDASGAPNFVAGSSYKVRLHFAELNFSQPGQRRFNVTINGNPVLTDFDIVAEAGVPYRAVIKEFTATAASNRGLGSIDIQLTAGSASVPLINGIEVLPATSTDATATSRRR